MEMKELLNIEDMTTAAYSPWQNGLCEKGHQVIDAMLEVIQKCHPDYPLDMLLGRASMVKNTMYDHHFNKCVAGRAASYGEQDLFRSHAQHINSL